MTAADSKSLHIPARHRLAGIGLGAVLVGLLATAAGLQPDSQGFGTHRQLGLPPCTIQSEFGMRCPACGMTTSWAYFTRGRLIAAARANLGGTLLAGLAGVLGPWLMASGIRGKWVGRPLPEWSAVAVCVTVSLVTLADWGCRLLINGR